MIRLLAVLLCAPLLSSCLATTAIGVAGATVGAAGRVAGAVVGTTVKVGGAVVDAAIPDGDDDDDHHDRGRHH